MWKAVVDAFNGSTQTPNDDNEQSYDFVQVQAIVKNEGGSQILLDVREPDEYASGHIPGVPNMPFRSHPLALHIPPSEFHKDFGFVKPGKEKELIMLCASGFRAGKAKNEALKAGYQNVSLYSGSMKDWVAKGGETVVESQS
ncbi:LADA_0C05292g1_1 [Lachancea dasiensis]|uniref:LADA_0C05292g1_1 n=1 Tax=Lachancea dasiensis TaxID=1072105 RepID=A0A1G4IYY1_9SACH|nr:LADA_0C05292g1_1 [Lachancea dasiensis]